MVSVKLEKKKKKSRSERERAREKNHAHMQHRHIHTKGWALYNWPSVSHTHTFYSIARKESKLICSSSIEWTSTRIKTNQARTRCLIDRKDFKHEIKEKEKRSNSNVNYIKLVDTRLLIPFNIHHAIHRSKSEKDNETFINAKPWWTIQTFNWFVSFVLKEGNHRYANDILTMLKNNNNNSMYQYNMTTPCLINMALTERSMCVCENDEWFLFRVSWYFSLRTLLSIIKGKRGY